LPVDNNFIVYFLSFLILCNHYITGLPKSQALFSLF
jgi:hypothetical protein